MMVGLSFEKSLFLHQSSPLMDNANLKGIIPITLKCKARWVPVEPYDVTSLSTQRRKFQWRESLLMPPTGQL